jgi:hypothetical protein
VLQPDGSNSTYSNTNPYCALIQRDSNGQLVNVVTPYLNLGALKTDGVEMQVNWATPARFIGNTGKIYATTTVGWLHAYKVQPCPAGQSWTIPTSATAQPAPARCRRAPRRAGRR